MDCWGAANLWENVYTDICATIENGLKICKTTKKNCKHRIQNQGQNKTKMVGQIVRMVTWQIKSVLQRLGPL